MQASVKNIDGEIVKKIKLNSEVFGVSMNEPVVHQVMLSQLYNTHIGTNHTKTRAEVRGGGRKPRPQKGSGSSRQGSIRSPQWKGGGVVFGPRSHRRRMFLPAKLRRLALKCMLSQKFKDGQLLVLDGWPSKEHTTSNMIKILAKLEVTKKAILVTKDPNSSVINASNNIQRVKSTVTNNLSVVDLLDYDDLVITVDALEHAQELWAKNKLRLSVKTSKGEKA